MKEQQKTNSVLNGYRILDLTEHGSMIGARMLGEFGADVIKIEPPGGSASRIAPFYKEIPDPEKSLYWFAYNLNKRGITLDITKPEGQRFFLQLVKTADVIMESFEPGYMCRLGLSYEKLCDIKPDIIVTSITPFGQNGPKSHYKGSDLSAWASGGFLNLCGDPDRPPVWISFPQASLHAGAEAASGTMAALWYRQMTNEGQQVDVSMQECVIAINFNAPETWDLNRMEFPRSSTHLNIGAKGVKAKQVWKCKDGYEFLISQAGAEPFLSSTKHLVEWMAKENMAPDWLKQMNWADDYSAATLTQDKVNQVEATFADFLITKSKEELFEEGALKRHIFTAPISNVRDLKENRQLMSRDFWTEIEHHELGDSLTYCGPFIRLSETPLRFWRRAPLIGEHNSEIYITEMGMTTDTVRQMKQEGVI
jgi:crotonobetainyl-CoA:carnitine CoA-transferase CaiB-like acyl-CoA transferase